MKKSEIVEVLKTATIAKYGREDGTINNYQIKKDTGMQVNQINSLFGECINPGINSFIALGDAVGVTIEAKLKSCDGCINQIGSLGACKSEVKCIDFNQYAK